MTRGTALAGIASMTNVSQTSFTIDSLSTVELDAVCGAGWKKGAAIGASIGAPIGAGLGAWTSLMSNFGPQPAIPMPTAVAVGTASGAAVGSVVGGIAGFGSDLIHGRLHR